VDFMSIEYARSIYWLEAVTINEYPEMSFIFIGFILCICHFHVVQ